MRQLVIAQWTPIGWVPMTYVSNKKAFRDGWKDLHEYDPSGTFRGFQRVVAENAPVGVSNVVWQLNDDRVFEEVEAWSMMSLETQNALIA